MHHVALPGDPVRVVAQVVLHVAVAEEGLGVCVLEFLEDLLVDLSIAANLVPDAHLAALAIEHGLILCSSDGDFGRFTNLKWQNPIS